MNQELSKEEKQHIKSMHFNQKLLYNKWHSLALEVDNIAAVIQNPFDLNKKFTTSDERLEFVRKAVKVVNEITELKTITLTHLQKIDLMESVLK